MRTSTAAAGWASTTTARQTNFHSSINYTLQEYANDIVATIQEACETRRASRIPTSSPSPGRALVAHHSVLVFNVLDVNEMLPGQIPRVAGRRRAPR